MKGFEEFHNRTENQKQDLWNNAIFVFDTNVFLNLYRYTEETAKDLMSILGNLDRVWIPHQVALEYNFNRRVVILQQLNSYTNIISEVEKSSSKYINELQERLKGYKRRHPRIDIGDMIKRIEDNINEVKSSVRLSQEEHPKNYMDTDPFYDELSTIFKDKIGDNEYNQGKLDEIFKEGEKRYSANVPPGYEDLVDKKGKIREWDGLYYKNEYGDLIVWKQILDKAKTSEMPVILVTDDEKEDWWQIISGRTVGPRYELLNEFTKETNQDFYMYKTYQFMEFAKNIMSSNVSLTSISEVKELKTMDTYTENGNININFLSENDKKHLRILVRNMEDGSDRNLVDSWINEKKKEYEHQAEFMNTQSEYKVEAIALTDFTHDELYDSIWSSDLESVLRSIYLIKEKNRYKEHEKFEFLVRLSKNISNSDTFSLLNRSSKGTLYLIQNITHHPY